MGGGLATGGGGLASGGGVVKGGGLASGGGKFGLAFWKSVRQVCVEGRGVESLFRCVGLHTQQQAGTARRGAVRCARQLTGGCMKGAGVLTGVPWGGMLRLVAPAVGTGGGRAGERVGTGWRGWGRGVHNHAGHRAPLARPRATAQAPLSPRNPAPGPLPPLASAQGLGVAPASVQSLRARGGPRQLHGDGRHPGPPKAPPHSLRREGLDPPSPPRSAGRGGGLRKGLRGVVIARTRITPPPSLAWRPPSCGGGVEVRGRGARCLRRGETQGTCSCNSSGRQARRPGQLPNPPF